MSLEDIQMRADEKLPAAGPEVHHEAKDTRVHTFRAKFFMCSFNEEQIGTFKLLDVPGKKFLMAYRMKPRPKAELEADEIFLIPDGSYDEERLALVDAVSEW